jgi:hypothetical protein
VPDIAGILIRLLISLSCKPGYKSVCPYVSPPIVTTQRLGKSTLIVARQRVGKTVTAATNTHAAIEGSLDASFYTRSVSYEGKLTISSSQNFLFCYEKIKKGRLF